MRLFFKKHVHSKGAAFLKQKEHSFSISSMSLKKVTFLSRNMLHFKEVGRVAFVGKRCVCQANTSF